MTLAKSLCKNSLYNLICKRLKKKVFQDSGDHVLTKHLDFSCFVLNIQLLFYNPNKSNMKKCQW